MKQSHNIISKFLFIFLLIPTFAQAKVIGRIVSIKGEVFVLDKESNTKTLKVGDKIHDFSEIMTEDNSQVSYVDYHDHLYHLSSNTQVTVMNKMTEMKSGKVWVQSTGKNTGFTIQTSNAAVDFTEGEFIFTYHPSKIKSQVVVIGGDVKFSNLLENHLTYTVHAGKFSFVDRDHDKGFPRKPTLIGYDSYNHLVGAFSGIKPQDNTLRDVLASQKSNQARGIASVGKGISHNGAYSEKYLEKKLARKFKLSEFNKRLPHRGQTYLVKKPEVLRLPASAEVSAFNYIKEVEMKEKKAKEAARFKGQTIPVRVFGQNPVSHPVMKEESVSRSSVSDKLRVFASKELPVKEQVKDHIKEMSRNPSSVMPKKVDHRKPASAMVKSGQDSDLKNFKDSLLKEYAEQKRHSNEVEQLIDELETYSDRFQKKH